MKKEIGIYCIGHTMADHVEVMRWLTDLGVSEDYLIDLPSEQEVSDPALLVGLAAKRCYMSFEVSLNKNLTKVRKDWVEYIDNVLASGHGSVLEHSVYNFSIENCSRVFTAEMNRHRAGWAISEGSLRFIRFDEDVPYWEPLSIRDHDGDDIDLRERKRATRELFEAEFTHQSDTYAKLVKIWDMDSDNHNFDYKKKITSCLRRIIGLGVCTGGVWTGNFRALRHVLAMRCAPSAEEEIAHVFSRIAKIMIEKEPLIFGDFSNKEGYYKPKYWKI